MSVSVIAAIGIGVTLVLIFLGAPIFLSLGMGGMLGIYLQSGFAGWGLVATSVYGSLCSFELTAAPLFILMGVIVTRSGMGQELFEFLHRLLYRVRGGLAISTIIAMAIFGAMSGVSLAAVAAIGVMALPEMIKRGYDKGIAAGAICAPGALAMLIPPSLLFILYGELAHASIGELFIAGILPGLLMAGLMIAYIVIRGIKNPALMPKGTEPLSWKQRLEPAKRLWAPILLIVAILGSIYGGFATPTESAAVGVVVASIIVLVYRTINWNGAKEIMFVSVRDSGVIFAIFIGTSIFISFLNLVKVPELFAQAMLSLGVSSWSAMVIVQLILLALGMFIDGASMVLITTPLFMGLVEAMGWDPIWFGVLMITNINIAVITPPVGLNLYTLGSFSKDVDMETILKGTLPYVVVEFIGLAILIAFPQISTWLPSLMRS
jgi:tripartite ATP-independent transporter DctM subunit